MVQYRDTLKIPKATGTVSDLPWPERDGGIRETVISGALYGHDRTCQAYFPDSRPDQGGILDSLKMALIGSSGG